MKKKATKRAARARRARRQIDPRLTQALSRSTKDAPIDAVILFHDEGKRAAGTGKSKSEKAVAQLAQQEPIEYNFFPNLGGVAVRATRAAMKKLLDLPDVKTATISA